MFHAIVQRFDVMDEKFSGGELNTGPKYRRKQKTNYTVCL